MSTTLGRPRLDDEEKLGAYVGVAVSSEMHDHLVLLARAAGYRSLSSYIRQRIFAPALAATGAQPGDVQRSSP